MKDPADYTLREIAEAAKELCPLTAEEILEGILHHMEEYTKFLRTHSGELDEESQELIDDLTRQKKEGNL